ncbi:MAG TPA: hypothetical protein VHX36_05565 [Candidatus Acidoferrales bacterium]|jgi:hypothetical protein|nr:hypothetical protein [Candidatus Acidoferrales bacterium]
MHDWEGSLRGVFVGAAVGVVFGLGGFFLSENHRTNSMGAVVFLLVPLAAGFAITMVAEGAQTISAAALLSTLVSLLTLILTKLETPVCALLAFPLIFTGLLCGIALGYLFHWLRRKLGSHGAVFPSMMVLAMPLVIVAGHRVELSTLVHPRTEVVTSSVQIEAAADRVWTGLQAFDTVIAPKPFLMHIGLPVPMSCVERGTGIGAKRTCYFDRGSIEETITQWSPPTVMGLSIDRTNMPGRHWLGFEHAEYSLHQDGGKTTVTRTTTIISNLYPAWYWRPFERRGVEDEHEYIFGDLSRRLAPDPNHLSQP